MNTLGNKDITYSHLARFEDGRHSNLRELAKRALDGMRVMLLATTINLSTLFYMSGKEQEWMVRSLPLPRSGLKPYLF